jgi:uncharacterized protein YoxC
MKDESKIEQITKLNQESQKKLLRFFIRLNLEMKLKTLKNQKKLFHKLKTIHNDINHEILTLCSLIISIEEIYNELDEVFLNSMQISSVNNKQNQKRQKLIGYWSIVKTLKNEHKLSFRQISEYLYKYHKFDISYSTIYEIWNELKEKGE